MPCCGRTGAHAQFLRLPASGPSPHCCLLPPHLPSSPTGQHGGVADEARHGVGPLVQHVSAKAVQGTCHLVHHQVGGQVVLVERDVGVALG
jgi:hypothetical protein